MILQFEAVGTRKRPTAYNLSALGAQPGDLVGMVVGQGIGLTLIGLAVGTVAGLALTKFAASQLQGILSADFWTFAEVALLITTVTLLACYVPARRTLRIDPIAALRYE
jgi:putative ABC transport system permease protein